MLTFVRQRNDVQGVYSIVHAPGFDVNQRYSVVTDATPLGWAVIADKGEMTAMLVEAGADTEAEIKFWGNQTWTPREYCRRYVCENAMRALETAKPLSKKFDVD